jgi:hypothetical protein
MSFQRITKSVSKKRAAPNDDADSDMCVFDLPHDFC